MLLPLALATVTGAGSLARQRTYAAHAAFVASEPSPTSSGALGALGAVVSGSGPTVAVLARDEAHAAALAAALTSSGACDDVRRAVGPVGGARVVEVR